MKTLAMKEAIFSDEESVFSIAATLFLFCESSGTRTNAIEETSVDGMKRSGITIPKNIPTVSRLSVSLAPDITKNMGSKNVYDEMKRLESILETVMKEELFVMSVNDERENVNFPPFFIYIITADVAQIPLANVKDKATFSVGEGKIVTDKKMTANANVKSSSTNSKKL